MAYFMSFRTTKKIHNFWYRENFLSGSYERLLRWNTGRTRRNYRNLEHCQHLVFVGSVLDQTSNLTIELAQ